MAPPSSVNPATGEVLARLEEHTDAEVERRLSRALEVFRVWRRRPIGERARRKLALERYLERWAPEVAG